MAVPSFPLFARLYRYFAVRRPLLFGVTILLVALMGLASAQIRLQEDIEAMLPDDSSRVAQDFRLLQLAPFTRKVVITLRGGAQTGPAELTAAADRLAEELASPLIRSVTTGPAGLAEGGMLPWLARSLPSLTTPEDLTRLAGWTEAKNVGSRLQESYERLLAPEGWALKGAIQEDPLSFASLALEKMRYVNMIPNMRLIDGHFVSADGTSALLIADTTVAMTDSGKARELLEHIDRQVGRVVPAQIKASVICGHRYTLANADAVKHDLYLILTLNALAILAIYIFFLRSLSAFFVFLVPSSVLVIASGVIGLSATNVFAVTMGFGGVLLGIADEYAMLIYFSCRKGSADMAATVAEVSRPVLFGAAATLLSLAVMFLSSLPGQRQLALYTMTGIVASLGISLIVLPHLIRPPTRAAEPRIGSTRTFSLPRRWTVGIWLTILVLCGWQATKLRFNGDLRGLSLVPAELREAEEELARTWGDMRGKAMIFAEGKDLEAALAVNDRVFARLSPALPAGELVSLAPILPSDAVRQANVRRWEAFWQQGEADRLAVNLQNSAARLGFAAGAFTPFLASLQAPPAFAGLDELRGAGLGELIDSLVLRAPETVRVMTLVPDTPEAVALVEQELKQIPEARLVSQSRFGDHIGQAINADFTRYMAVTLLLVLALVIVLFRNPGRIALVLVPIVTGLICMLGIMGLLGIEFNLFNIVATILIIGLCVDYGIFMTCRLTEGSNHDADRAVLVSGLTTLVGFGSLAFARHPSMHSIGITVLIGIGTGIPAALLVIPALYGWKTSNILHHEDTKNTK